jgi:hypothetical protein
MASACQRVRALDFGSQQAMRTAEFTLLAVCSAEEARLAAEKAAAAQRECERLEQQLSCHEHLEAVLRKVVNMPGLCRQVQSCVTPAKRKRPPIRLTLHRCLLSGLQLLQSNERREACMCLS